MNEQFPKKTVSSKVVYKNQWITIHEDQTITKDGNKGMYGYMESRDSVMVAVVNDQKNILLVHAFRYPSKSWGWELPGGGGDGEHYIEASKRELEEETGILAQSWDKLGETIVCNGLMTEKQITCAAWNINFDGNKEVSDEVFRDMKFVPISEAIEMAQTGEINDNQTITGLFFAEKWLAGGGVR